MTATPHPHWVSNALSILEEGVECYRGDHLRAALHAAYDTFTYVCETGLNKRYSKSKAPHNPDADPVNRHTWRLNEVHRVRTVPKLIYAVLSNLGFHRNNMAHQSYGVPTQDDVERALVAVILFLDVVGVPPSPPLRGFLPFFEEHVDDDTYAVHVSGPLLNKVMRMGEATSTELGFKLWVPYDSKRIESRGCLEFRHDLMRIVVKAWKSASEASVSTTRSNEATRDKQAEPLVVNGDLYFDYHEPCHEWFAGQVSLGDYTWELSRDQGCVDSKPTMSHVYSTNQIEDGYFYTVKIECLPALMLKAEQLISLALTNFHWLGRRPNDVAED